MSSQVTTSATASGVAARTCSMRVAQLASLSWLPEKDFLARGRLPQKRGPPLNRSYPHSSRARRWNWAIVAPGTSSGWRTRMPDADPHRAIDPVAAKQAIFEYCRKRGALAVGVAELAALERIAPAGHRPSDLMPRVRSVISLGVGGQTQGTWQLPARA